MPQLGDPVAMMVDFNFQKSSLIINPLTWSKPYSHLVLMISLMFLTQVLEAASCFQP